MRFTERSQNKSMNRKTSARITSAQELLDDIPELLEFYKAKGGERFFGPIPNAGDRIENVILQGGNPYYDSRAAKDSQEDYLLIF